MTANMKTIILLLAVVATLAAASPAKGSTKAAFKKECLKVCNDSYEPICAGGEDGSKPISFGNECVLGNYNCENNKNLKVVQKGECPGGDSVRLS